MLLLAGCSSGSTDDGRSGPPHRRTRGAPDGFDVLTPEARDEQALVRLGFGDDFLTLAEQFTPASVPETAVPLLHTVVPQGSSAVDDVIPASNGVAEGQFFLSVGPIALDLNVVCLVNRRQVPCSPEADGWRAELQPHEFVAPTFRIDAESGDRIGFVHLVDDGLSRVFPPVGLTEVHVDAPAEPSAVPVAPAEPVFDGCDVAVVVADLAPRSSPVQPDPLPAGDLLASVQVCDPLPTAVTVLLLADRSRIVAATEEFGRALVPPASGDLALRIPSAVVEDAEVLQVLAVLEGVDDDRLGQVPSFEVSVAS